MRAIEFSMFGDPGEVLELASLPDPTPAPDQVLVRMTARPINPSDLYMIRGHYGFLPALPAVPGLEGCGVIEALGSDVTGYRIGQRVIPIVVSAGGTWAEYVVTEAARHALIPVPDRLSDDQAAQFAVNSLSAWVMVRERLRLNEGAWLVQTAAGSAVGRIVTKLCASFGVQTINIVHRPERAAELGENGVKHVICSSTDDVYDQIMARTGGAGVDGGLDAVGGNVATEVARTLRRNAKLVIYGLLSGKTTTFDTSALLFHANTIEGFWLPDILRRAPECFAEAAAELAAYPILSDLVGNAGAHYEMADFRQAVRHAERSGRGGKVMLVS